MDRYWHAAAKENTSVEMADPISDLVYVGITDVSVEIHTKSGEHFRITNSDFVRGFTILVSDGEEEVKP